MVSKSYLPFSVSYLKDHVIPSTVFTRYRSLKSIMLNNITIIICYNKVYPKCTIEYVKTSVSGLLLASVSIRKTNVKHMGAHIHAHMSAS